MPPVIAFIWPVLPKNLLPSQYGRRYPVDCISATHSAKRASCRVWRSATLCSLVPNLLISLFTFTCGKIAITSVHIRWKISYLFKCSKYSRTPSHKARVNLVDIIRSGIYSQLFTDQMIMQVLFQQVCAISTTSRRFVKR